MTSLWLIRKFQTYCWKVTFLGEAAAWFAIVGRNDCWDPLLLCCCYGSTIDTQGYINWACCFFSSNRPGQTVLSARHPNTGQTVLSAGHPNTVWVFISLHTHPWESCPPVAVILQKQTAGIQYCQLQQAGMAFKSLERPASVYPEWKGKQPPHCNTSREGVYRVEMSDWRKCSQKKWNSRHYRNDEGKGLSDFMF